MVSSIRTRWNSHFGGVLLVAVIAAAATFLSEHYGAPAMLFALLIGMAFHFLNDDPAFAPGLEFSAKTLLRLGVGLLGLRLTVGDVESVGFTAVAAVVGFVLATLACGAVLAFLFGRRLAFGLLAGGSVAICGASAALAISSVLPARAEREHDTLFVVIGVTALSTVAMIAYPILFRSIGMSDLEAGFLIGATIHDVAQVVGAGYSISEEAGVIATFVKMVRVALLPVVMIVVMMSFRGARSQKVSLPWFLVMFIGLAIVTNTGIVPPAVNETVAALSRWCLVIAISALGVKTSLATILRVKPSYGIILVTETLFLLALAVAFIFIIGL
ncbi:YeiH family protein [Notoacmeibacter marinus]|uniref:YeiH family protein n=1 Tax=Notoacmeibacter marinus TaxID=1876515 RepID=UPI000DF12A67|nr:putative sulfate exporter family transporter [Notoacmeibacter marinus]